MTMVGVAVTPATAWLRRRGGFSPASLFASGEEGAWYDPSDLSTLWQDAAGTTPVTAADQPVGRIDDKSGNGNHATQSTAGSRPLYKTAGGLHWLAFDGVDDDLLAPGLASVLGASGTRQYAMAIEAQDTAGLFVANAGTSPYVFIYESGSSSTTLATNGTLSAVRKNGASTSYATRGDAYTVFAGLGVVTAQHSTSGASWSTVRLGSAYNGFTYASTSHWYGFFVRNGAVTGSDLANLESYLAAKSGVTL